MATTMETPRLRLEPITLSHLDGFHRIWSDPLATRWSSRGTLSTLDQTQAWLSGLLPETKPGADNYAIFLRSPTTTPSTNPINNTTNPNDEMITLDSTTLLGVVGVHRVDPVPELGYILHPSAWGKGYATEAVAAFIQHFWKARPDLDIIEAKVDEENPESVRVLVKCGFVVVEVLEGGAEIPWLVPRKRNLVVYRLTRGTGSC